MSNPQTPPASLLERPAMIPMEAYDGPTPGSDVYEQPSPNLSEPFSMEVHSMPMEDYAPELSNDVPYTMLGVGGAQVPFSPPEPEPEPAPDPAEGGPVAPAPAAPAPAAPAPAAPAPAPAEGVEGGSRRVGGNLSVKPPSFRSDRPLTNQDFYGERRDLSWVDAAGNRMDLPRHGQLPLGIISDRIRQNQSELAEVRKRINDLKTKSSTPPKTADPYQQSFNKMFFDGERALVNSIAEQYDGQEDKAWREIATEGTEANRKYMQYHADMQAIASYGKFLSDDAKAIMESAADGKLEYTPEMARQAEEVYYGLRSMRGSDGSASIRNLTEGLHSFRRHISLHNHIKQFMLPNIQDRYKQWQEAKMYRDKKTGMNIVEVKKNYDATAFLKETARDLARFQVYGTEKEIFERLKQHIPPEKLELSITARNPPKPSGSKSGGSDNAKKGPIVRADYRFGSVSSDQPTGQGSADGRSVSLTPYEVTSGKEHAVKQIEVSRGGEETYSMQFPTLVHNTATNKWSIQGRMLNQQGTKLLTDLETSDSFSVVDGASDEDLGKMMESREQQRKSIIEKYSVVESVPVEFNTSVLAAKWGASSPEELVSKALAEKGVTMTPEEVYEANSTPGGRLKIAESLGVSSKPKKSAAAPTSKGTAAPSKPKKTIPGFS